MVNADFILQVEDNIPISLKPTKGDSVLCVDISKADLESGDILAVVFPWAEYKAILCKLWCSDTDALFFPLHDDKRFYGCDEGFPIGKAIGIIHSFGKRGITL